MRSQLALQCLVLFLAVGTVTSFGPLAQQGLASMRDFFGGAGADASSAANTMGNGMGSITDMMGNGMGSITGMMGNGLGSLGSMFGPILEQIMGSWSSIIKSMLGSGGDMFGSLFKIVQDMINNFFSIFGNLSFGSRLQINKAIQGTGQVAGTVMKLKLNPEKNQVKLKKEILAIQKVMESKHKNHDELIKQLKSKAPSIAAAAQLAFGHAKQEAQKHMKTFTPESKKGVQQMHAVINKAGMDFGGILGMIPGMLGSVLGGASQGGNSVLSMGFSLLQNFFGLFTKLISSFL